MKRPSYYASSTSRSSSRVGERAGLSGLPAYEAARDDARKLQTAGAVVRRRANDTTVELNLQIR